jgi:FkbM family methyltransferase
MTDPSSTVGGPAEVTATLLDGQRMQVLVPEVVGNDLVAHGQIEPDVTAMLRDHLQPGMVFIDVGAHYGYFTLLAGRLVAPTGTVVAFEPTRTTARLLRRNVGAVPGVIVEECAVTDRTGTVEFRDFGTSSSALNTVLAAARVPEPDRRDLRASTYQVPSVSLDDYTAARGLRPDVIKVDAEGAELAILSGMPHVLDDVRPILILETGDYADMAAPPTAASLDLLDAAGYDPLEYTDGALRPHQRRATYGYSNLFFVPR